MSKRHTFIVAGWTADDSDGDYDPIYCSISNCEDDQGRMLDRARDDFHSRTHRLVAFERYATYEAGQPLRDTERLQMERAVSSALRSPGGKERAASIVLLRTLEGVSQRTDAVGGGAFISAVPQGYDFEEHMEPKPGEPGNRGFFYIGGGLFWFLGMRWGLPTAGVATFAHVADEGGYTTVDTPLVMSDWWAGKAKLSTPHGDWSRFIEEGQVEMNSIALVDSEPALPPRAGSIRLNFPREK